MTTPAREATAVVSVTEVFSRYVARAIVWLRYPILLAWIAGAALARHSCPRHLNLKRASSAACCRGPRPRCEVERKAIKTFGLPLLSRTIVIAHQPSGFSPAQIAAATALHRLDTDRQQGHGAIRAVPLLDTPGLLASHRTATTLVAYLYIDPTLSESESAGQAPNVSPPVCSAGLRRRRRCR